MVRLARLESVALHSHLLRRPARRLGFVAGAGWDLLAGDRMSDKGTISNIRIDRLLGTSDGTKFCLLIWRDNPGRPGLPGKLEKTYYTDVDQVWGAMLGRVGEMIQGARAENDERPEGGKEDA